MKPPLRDDILAEHSKAQTLRILARIGDDPAAFAELVDLFLHDEKLVAQRAAWPLGYCLEKHPEWARAYLPELLRNLRKPGIHDAVKRNTVRALQTVPVPEELAGEAAELLSQYIADPREPLAVRCFSMTAFFNLGKNEPDLLEELRLVIEDILANETAGSLHARGKKVLKDIQTWPKNHFPPRNKAMKAARKGKNPIAAQTADVP